MDMWSNNSNFFIVILKSLICAIAKGSLDFYKLEDKVEIKYWIESMKKYQNSRKKPNFYGNTTQRKVL